jgi:hypothetical protein
MMSAARRALARILEAETAALIVASVFALAHSEIWWSLTFAVLAVACFELSLETSEA